MEVIDAQIHVWEHAPPPRRAWEHDALTAHSMPVVVTYDAAIAAMDSVGVDAAVLSAPPTYRRRVDDAYYRYDNSFAEEAAADYPGRFCSVARLDPLDPELEDELTRIMQGVGVVGLRVAVTRPALVEQLREGKHERLFTAAEQQQVPIMLLAQPEMDAVGPVAETHPDLRIILDHVGVVQPNMHVPTEPEPLDRLPEVLALAVHPNVSVKITGIVTLSHEPYPFVDLREPLRRLIDAFGPDRLLWGSDYTRTKGIATYAEAMHWFKYCDELTDEERTLIFGANARRILSWPATA